MKTHYAIKLIVAFALIGLAGCAKSRLRIEVDLYTQETPQEDSHGLKVEAMVRNISVLDNELAEYEKTYSKTRKLLEDAVELYRDATGATEAGIKTYQLTIGNIQAEHNDISPLRAEIKSIRGVLLESIQSEFESKMAINPDAQLESDLQATSQLLGATLNLVELGRKVEKTINDEDRKGANYAQEDIKEITREIEDDAIPDLDKQIAKSKEDKTKNQGETKAIQDEIDVKEKDLEKTRLDLGNLESGVPENDVAPSGNEAQRNRLNAKIQTLKSELNTLTEKKNALQNRQEKIKLGLLSLQTKREHHVKLTKKLKEELESVKQIKITELELIQKVKDIQSVLTNQTAQVQKAILNPPVNPDLAADDGDPTLREITDSWQAQEKLGDTSLGGYSSGPRPKEEKQQAHWAKDVFFQDVKGYGNAGYIIVRDTPVRYTVQRATQNPKVLIETQLRLARTGLKAVSQIAQSIYPALPIPQQNGTSNANREPTDQAAASLRMQMEGDARRAAVRNLAKMLQNKLRAIEEEYEILLAEYRLKLKRLPGGTTEEDVKDEFNEKAKQFYKNRVAPYLTIIADQLDTNGPLAPLDTTQPLPPTD